MLGDSSGAWVEVEGKDHSRSTVRLKTVPYHHNNTKGFEVYDGNCFEIYREEGRDRPYAFIGSVSRRVLYQFASRFHDNKLCILDVQLTMRVRRIVCNASLKDGSFWIAGLRVPPISADDEEEEGSARR